MFLWLKELLDWRTERIEYKARIAHEARERQYAIDAEMREYHANERERQRQHALDLKICNSCQILEDELARSHSREKELIALIKGTVKEPEEHKPFESKVELPNLRKPWAVKRQELERASRRESPKNNKPVTPDNLDDEIELVRDNA